MKKRIIITDLSQKYGGVCVFGYDEENNGIRPIIVDEDGKLKEIEEDYIKKYSIEPFTQIEFDFIRDLPQPPHTEDWVINEDYQPKTIRTFSEKERKEFLGKISYDSIKTADWGTEIHLYSDKRGKNIAYINPGEGKRSIITIKIKNISFVEYSEQDYKPGKYNYRITFSDMIGDDLSVTDLVFRKYCDILRGDGKSCGFIGGELQRKLNQRDVFLRIGTGRPFDPMGGNNFKCFLFITGIYAFPDYKN